MAVAAILVFSRSLRFGPLDRRFVPENPWIAGTRHLGQFWSSRGALKIDHQWIQSGPYARVRHPIDSGLLLTLIGTALFVGEWRSRKGRLCSLHTAQGTKGRGREFGVIYQQYCGKTVALIPQLF